MNPIELIFIAGGVFSIYGAVTDWDWFINHHKARFYVSILGRSGARVFYGVLGIVLIVLGALMALGILKDAQ
ncbi:MAG: hypothetical protein EBR10_08040 [Planctomycetes bacterium]|nr:hypothetical protein [Planctomycetota bacterium]